MVKVVLALFLVLSTIPCFAQKEANEWYFGRYAGLSFKTANPQPLYDGKLNSYEACATVCDKNGNLLFYTEGINVWNRNHQTMPNGTGLVGGSIGSTFDNSSAQGVMIVPDPSNSSRYYIFVTPQIPNNGINPKTFKLTAYLVDMTRDNGLGDVLSARIDLNPSSEKLTGTIDFFGTGFRIVSHHIEDNEFYDWGRWVYSVDLGGNGE